MAESLLYRQLGSKKIQCQACQRQCLISDQQVGFCLARQNLGGALESLLYGQITGIQVDPIEKKPFYHFKPGQLVATIGSWGCNFRCKQCLNFANSWGATEELAQLKKLREKGKAIKTPAAEEIAQTIADGGHAGIAFSYNEPTIWAEFANQIAQEFKARATAKNPFAVFVTNGSWTKETIDLLAPNIDAANIDLKGFCQETYRKQGAFLGIIPEMAVYAQKKGIFLELTTLLIPGINDDPDELRDLASWIVKDLGPDTPWHLSQFDPRPAPDPEFQKIPFTTAEELKHAVSIGEKAGLHHLYIWAPEAGCNRSDTLCPNCRNIVIKRNGGWQPREIKIKKDQHCQFCNFKLNVIL
jgi:pyruvate formate lyase activating enzyme